MSVRVIAGRLGRRVLRAPDGLSTRPTSARVREAMFSILGDLAGLRALDLYAGSGALGIEALSRGASTAVFVERDRAALECIRRNISDLSLSECTRVLPGTVESALRRLAQEPSFELVFIDPPWADMQGALRALRRLPDVLSPNSRVVLEHPARDVPDLEQLTLYDQRSWGDTGVAFFRVRSSRFDPAADQQSNA